MLQVCPTNREVFGRNMQTITTIAALREQLRSWRDNGERIAFVPTMGNLHAGHLHLITEARKRAPRCVASIFVNPLQFGAGEDFQTYPRTLAEDSTQLAAAGVDVLFAPTVDEMYPAGATSQLRVEVGPLGDILCGQSRPGHFTGVATVVAKLFNIVQPDVALFGEKDFQQLLVIRRLVADLSMAVEIVGVATVREAHGLAMSSRNAYLSAAERVRAPLLYQALLTVSERLGQGAENFSELTQTAMTQLQAAGFQPEYVSVRRAADLAEPTRLDSELVVLAAARLGKTRLIDNVKLEPGKL